MNHFGKREPGRSPWFTLSAILMLFLILGTASARSSSSIKSILSPNGSIRSGVTSGSFDARGYSMVTTKNGTPRFLKTSSVPGDGDWDPSFTVAGVGGSAYVVANSGNMLYVGGSFGSAGNVVLNNIAKYNINTNTWSALDSTSSDLGTNGPVFSILVNGSDVFIGGAFTDAGGVAANNIVDYNSSTGQWSTLGSGTSNGVDNQVNCMLYFGGNLYVAGDFANAGGNAASFIAKWNPGTSTWSALGAGVDNTVITMAVYNSQLYAGGSFLNAGGSPANYIASWNGTNWSTVGTSATDLNGPVNAIAPYANGIYLGGGFTTAGTSTVNGMTRWDGTSWHAVGPGVNGSVSSLLWSGSELYVLGYFTAAGLITVNYIATVDTLTNVWSQLGTGTTVGTNFYVSGGDLVNGVLYTAGYFTIAGGVNAFGIAAWNGTTWASLGGTTNVPGGNVFALAINGSTIYVGGRFQTAGPVLANNIASYNTSTHSWAALGSATSNGVDNTVYAITVLGGNVYVGGAFANAGGSPAKHVAMWNGTVWSTLGTSPSDGVNNAVFALSSFGADLYVGGSFTSLGSGSSARYIAKWNGTSWSALGTGTNGTNNVVYAIAAGTSQIYAGGAFTTAGGSAVSHIASWNGVNWSALGNPNGVSGNVEALYAVNDTVYVGGNFTSAGGNSANYVAKWNTHQWTPLAAGVNGPVYAITGSGTNLYIGGNFTTSGLVNAYDVIEWSTADSSFTTLGSGTNTTVRCIVAMDSDNTYYGGLFSTAGDKPSYRFAHYSPTLTAVNEQPGIPQSFELMQNYPNPFNPTTVISYQLANVGHVTLKVYDILGRQVATLVDGVQSPGLHNVVFDGSKFASGVYLYRIQNGNYTRTMKMVLVK